MPATMREAQALDWLDDLRGFGPDIVAAACGDWRRQPGGRRPTPGDIRALCIREREEHRSTDRLALPSPDQDRIAAARGENSRMRRAKEEEAKLYRDAMAQGLGFGSFAEWMAFGLVAGSKRTPRSGGGDQVRATRDALGVTAAEFSSERMAADRAALGMVDS